MLQHSHQKTKVHERLREAHVQSLLTASAEQPLPSGLSWMRRKQQMTGLALQHHDDKPNIKAINKTNWQQRPQPCSPSWCLCMFVYCQYILSTTRQTYDQQLLHTALFPLLVSKIHETTGVQRLHARTAFADILQIICNKILVSCPFDNSD